MFLDRCSNDEASARGKIDGTRPVPASGDFLRLDVAGGLDETRGRGSRAVRGVNILHPPDRATRRKHQHPREHGRPRGTTGRDVRNSRRRIGICISSGDGIVPVRGRWLRDQHGHGVPFSTVDCVQYYYLWCVWFVVVVAVDTHYCNMNVVWCCRITASTPTAFCFQLRLKKEERTTASPFLLSLALFFFGLFKKKFMILQVAKQLIDSEFPRELRLSLEGVSTEFRFYVQTVLSSTTSSFFNNTLLLLLSRRRQWPSSDLF